MNTINKVHEYNIKNKKKNSTKEKDKKYINCNNTGKDGTREV